MWQIFTKWYQERELVYSIAELIIEILERRLLLDLKKLIYNLIFGTVTDTHLLKTAFSRYVIQMPYNPSIKVCS